MRPLLAALLLLVSFTAASAENVQQGLKVPDGFEVTEYADSQLANDIFTLTLDPRGRVVVSGPGYIRILVEDEKTGKATQAVEVAQLKNGTQAMLWEGDTLYCVADGGLRRFKIENDKAVGDSELIRALKTGGEHHAHAIKRGPDGWLYVLCGNTTGIDLSYATLLTTPIRKPTGGCLIRFTPDLKNSEVVADGFRNPYDFDFNVNGDIFTYDSDNERCVSLPWYEGTRFCQVIPGGRYGWRTPQHGQFFRLPHDFPDVVPALDYLGRGSPTGVVCYRHVQFPAKYRGNFLLADWTFGRIYHVKLQRAGSTYKAEREVFLQATGDNGFAPTALAVQPKTGDLFVSIGGRGTRGAVYRIRYPAGAKLDEAALEKLKIAPRSLDWKPEYLDQAAKGDAPARLQALIEIRRYLHKLNAEQIMAAVRANWDQDDRQISRATADLLGLLPERERRLLGQQAKAGRQQLVWALGCAAVDAEEVISRTAAQRSSGQLAGELGLWQLRALQLALGDLTNPKLHGTNWEGYSRLRGQGDIANEELLQALRNDLSSGEAPRVREAGRILAMIEDDDPNTLAQLGNMLPGTTSSVDLLHALTVLARLRAPRTDAITKQTADALVSLDDKVAKEKLNRENHWSLRVAELHAGLSAQDGLLNAHLLGHKDFGRPDHALFTRTPGFDRKKAAKLFLARAEKDADYAWNGDVVALVGELPAKECLPVLRKLWGSAGLEEAILPVLARQAEAEDRDKLLHGLNSPQPATVKLCLTALQNLPGRDVEAKHVLALILALRRLGDSKDEKQLQGQLVQYLRTLTGQDKLPEDKQAWTDWFAKAHPDLAARLSGPDGVDVAAWGKRLEKIDWNAGDGERGGKVFIKANCASCHSGAQALGPDLRGVTSRFSRADLLTSILQPSKDIANRYRTSQVETAAGKIYQGLIIYEATDSVILQTGPTVTTRLDGAQVASKRFTDVSLMPAGLMDMLKNEEIADLYAYLRGLTAPEKKD
ncbi:MAG: c-type cytochrome [Planctomycetia bacterium]|nr:c-type cytochrome [Planctomycetia bacterium]